MPTDQDLYSSFLSGHTPAYDELMLRHGDSLVFYLYGYLHNWQDAEDLMIEAFARVMVKKPSLRRGTFKAYLYKTARNLASRFHYTSRRAQVFSLDSLESEISERELLEEVLLKDERKKLLHLCLSRIGEEVREALWLIYFEDMSYKEAAAVLGCNTKKIDHLLQRGKQQLKIELEKEGIRDAYQ